MLPGVDPVVGPVAGQVYVDVERLQAARDLQLGWKADPSAFVLSDPTASFDLKGFPLSQVIQTYFDEVARSPYVLCSEVLGDQSFVSLRAAGPALDQAVLVALLEANGLQMRNVGGVALICNAEPMPDLDQQLGKDGEIFVYVPKFRSVADLVRVASPLVHGVFSSSGQESEELLIFASEEKHIKRLEKLLDQVDKPVQSVMVHAMLFELSTGDVQASALRVIGEVLGGRVGFQLGSTGGVLPSSLSVVSSSVEAIASIISEDSRFKMISSPFVRVRNGSRGRFQSGQDVPVQGEILFNPNGQSSQSVRYVSSGVILDVSVLIRGDSIDLDLVQTVSSFVKTQVGDQINPTLNKRELTSNLSVRDGEIVILGGLSDTTKEESRQGLFGWNFAKSHAKTESQLVLILQAKII